MFVMNKYVKISIYLNVFHVLSFISAAYLEAESNFVKPKLERNNIVNKGLWIRSNRDRKYTNDFIFRANSLDVDNVLQNNYDAFGQNNVANSAFFSGSGYNMERNRRSINEKIKSRFTKKCDNKSNCPSLGVKSKIISTLKPASVFKDHPYEIAVLLNNKKAHFDDISEQDTEFYNLNRSENKNNSKKAATQSMNSQNNIDKENSTTEDYNLAYTIFSNANENKSLSNRSSIIPKRSMNQHAYESEVIKKIEFSEDYNITDGNINVIDRNIYDKANTAWHNAPIPNVNVYKVLPKNDENLKNKPINERGILKILALLTKAFKRITKQHQDIKGIHDKLYELNDDFTKNGEILMSKFNDFNSKYLFMMKLNEELQIMQVKLQEREQKFNNREKELSKNLKEFENQQKKFLAQQRQFYNVQKLMLAQNEKINLKQSVISNTQSEISHKQNSFAKILKKAKQIYIDSRNMSPTKFNAAIAKPKIKPITVEPVRVDYTTFPPPITETVKINLFSIPTLNRLENQDQLILDEKDYQPVDELIYKYYFNNTFIDDLMRNKILATFVAASEATESNAMKNKRNEKHKMKTFLVPVNSTVESSKKNRNKRWIKYSKKNNQKKDFKGTPTPINRAPDSKENLVHTEIDYKKIAVTKKVDPFMTMALSFCKEIGQSVNLQVFDWCIEKVLRRLKVIDLKMSPLMAAGPPLSLKGSSTTSSQISLQQSTISQTSPTPTVQNQNGQIPVTHENIKTVMFFPDNDELENKLQEYDLKPDTEGTVYYDGSLHASDIAHIDDVDSEGFSDIMPGLDSNSRVQVDPVAFDLQAQRRADVRKINARIMRMGMDR